MTTVLDSLFDPEAPADAHLDLMRQFVNNVTLSTSGSTYEEYRKCFVGPPRVPETPQQLIDDAAYHKTYPVTLTAEWTHASTDVHVDVPFRIAHDRPGWRVVLRKLAATALQAHYPAPLTASLLFQSDEGSAARATCLNRPWVVAAAAHPDRGEPTRAFYCTVPDETWSGHRVLVSPEGLRDKLVMDSHLRIPSMDEIREGVHSWKVIRQGAERTDILRDTLFKIDANNPLMDFIRLFNDRFQESYKWDVNNPGICVKVGKSDDGFLYPGLIIKEMADLIHDLNSNLDYLHDPEKMLVCRIARSDGAPLGRGLTEEDMGSFSVTLEITVARMEQ